MEDEVTDTQQKRSSYNRKRILFALVVVGIFTCGVAVFGGTTDFFAQAALVARKTFSDVFLASSEKGNPVIEIDLERAGEAHGAVRLAQEDVFRAAEEGRTGENNTEAKAPLPVPQRNSASAQSSGEDDRKNFAVSSPDAGTDEMNIKPRICDAVIRQDASREMIVNEVAWMGSAESANDEWIELKNISGHEVSINGWQVVDGSGKIRILFDDKEMLRANALYLLERTDDTSVPNVRAQRIYSGALSNDGDRLTIMKSDCTAVDAVDATSGWPAGENDTKKTMERNDDGIGWHASIAAQGTPGSENSRPPVASAPLSNTQQPSPPSPAQIPRAFTLTVSRSGEGSGSIASAPAGINCGDVCDKEFTEQTSVALTAVPISGALFGGWSGACSGTAECVITMGEDLSATALFNLVPPVPIPEPEATSSAIAEPRAVSHIVIYEVQITGGVGKANNDFIRLYNPTDTAISIGGWKLRKKTQSGTESSVRVLPEGNAISARGYFLWANSEDNFALSLNADASSTQTLASNNSIVLRNADDAHIDALAWGAGHVNPFIEGNAFPENPSGEQVLKRKSVDGMVQDADDNASDFVL